MKKFIKFSVSLIAVAAMAFVLSPTVNAINFGKLKSAVTNATKSGDLKDLKDKALSEAYKAGTKMSVTIESIPQSVEEFQALQEKLGKDPKGAVALEVVAIEMYRQLGKEIGTECIKLCNTDLNVGSVTSRIKELFRENDSYARPYQMAAFMKGASPENGYNPDKPYVIEMFPDRTTKPQRNSDGTTELFFQIISHGHDVGSQRVYVVKPNGSEYYLVDNCPGLYSQVKKIAYGQEFNGL